MRKEDAWTAIGFCLPLIVFIVFLTLKLSSAIRWSWLWVTSPLWIVPALALFIAIIYIAVFAYRYRKYISK